MSYMGDNGEYTLTWYYPSNHGNLKYLISKSKSGTRAVWKFYDFIVSECVEEHRIPDEDKAEYEIQKKSIADYAEKYVKNADTSPYTLGEMLSLIYGASSADDIESVSFSPPQTGVGYSNAYQDNYTAADADKIYDILSKVEFYGMDYIYGKSELRKDIALELSQEELNKGGSCRIFINLKNGDIIDNWHFDPVVCNLYEYSNRCSGIIPHEDAETLISFMNR